MIIALYPFVAFPIALFAQDILFTIDNKPVYSEEFIHVYRKNNINNKDAFSKKDIDEYLTLFINFKLRVHEAYQQKLDTIISLNNEYESYKEQLRKPYLTDQKVTDALLKEAYDRYKFDIKASHILIRVSPNANPDDTLKAYQKIQDIRNMATSGKSFSDLARQYSEDPGGRENGGELGYFSALQMVYPFETAAYNTSVGEISTPVRTRFGYHLIKIEDKKLSAGKIQVAHIMIRNIPNQSVDEITSTRDKIFSVYDQLKAGYPWDDVCKLYSEDVSSREKGGLLKPFRYGSMPPEFSEASYSLNTPGDFSDPFQTAYGWHIVKLINYSPLESYEEMRPIIQNTIQRDERADISKKAVLEKLKKENGFEENSITRERLTVALLQHNKIEEPLYNSILFIVGDKNILVSDFLTSPQDRTRDTASIEKSLNQYRDSQILQYEESVLEKKYPEYHFLLKEYREGILLFHLMDEKIWSGASRDSIGLKEFFLLNQERYTWGKRYQGTIYESLEEESIKGLYDFLLTNSGRKNDTIPFEISEELAKKVNVEKGIFESGHHKAISNVDMDEGLHITKVDNINYLVHIERVIPSGYKSLEEIKGNVISDYQQTLEENWIRELKEKYIVKIQKKEKKYVYKELTK